MTTIFRSLASDLEAAPIKGQVQLISDADIDVSDPSTPLSWSEDDATYWGNIYAEATYDATGLVTFHYPGIYQLELSVGIGDDEGANLAASEPFGVVLDATGSTNFTLGADIACNWETKFASAKHVGSWTLIVEAGDTVAVDLMNTNSTADRTANATLVITRLDRNFFDAAETPPLP